MWGGRAVAAAVVAAISVFLALAIPSAGQAGTDLNALVDSEFTGSGTVAPDAMCPQTNGQLTIQDSTYGAGEPPDRSGTIHVEACVQVLTLPFPVEGTFLLQSGNGSTLRGTLRGTTTGGTFENTVTVTSGSGDFDRAGGTIRATGTANTGDGQVEDIEGTMTGSLFRLNQTTLHIDDPTPRPGQLVRISGTCPTPEERGRLVITDVALRQSIELASITTDAAGAFDVPARIPPELPPTGPDGRPVSYPLMVECFDSGATLDIAIQLDGSATTSPAQPVDVEPDFTG